MHVVEGTTAYARQTAVHNSLYNIMYSDGRHSKRWNQNKYDCLRCNLLLPLNS